MKSWLPILSAAPLKNKDPVSFFLIDKKRSINYKKANYSGHIKALLNKILWREVQSDFV
ncbi:MAG: hypothetical protein WBI18_10315 [Candidatus Saccharicenans sp.]